MAKVTGIGGVFLRAEDPAALAAWYAEALGVPFSPDGPFAILPGDVPDSVSVLSLFEASSTYLGEPGRQDAMVNYRVDDLDGVLERLSAAGATAEPVLEEANGRFSWSTDPEGNRFELWEPSAG